MNVHCCFEANSRVNEGGLSELGGAKVGPVKKILKKLNWALARADEQTILCDPKPK